MASKWFDRGPNRLFLDRNSGRSLDGFPVSGSVGVVQANFTVSTGGVTVSLTPSDFLGDGKSDIVLIQGVLGSLSRTGAVYTFTPDSSLSTPVVVSGGSKIFPTQSRIPGILYIGSIKLEQLGKFLNINASLALFDRVKLKLSNWKYSFMVSDGAKVALGVLRNGQTRIASLNLADNLWFRIGRSYRFLTSVTNKAGDRVYVGVTRRGALFARKAEISQITSRAASKKSAAHWADRQGRAPVRIGPDGSLIVRSLKADFVKIGASGTYRPTKAVIFGFPLRGQSNSTGYQSFQLPNNYQRGLAYKLVDGNPSGQFLGTAADRIAIAPLVEPFRTITQPNQNYPGNVFGETPATAIAATLAAKFLGPGFMSIWDTAGISGKRYSEIKKGSSDTNSYASALYIVQKMKAMADAMGLRLVIPCAPFLHGETDAEILNATYGANLIEEADNVNIDYKAITGQTETIPLLIDQQSMMPWNTFPVGGSLAQLAASITARGKVVLVEPSYHYHHYDIAHLDSWSTRRRGAKWAQAIATLMSGKLWEPLRPISAIKTAGKVTIKLNVPFGRLQWNRHIVQPASININGTDGANPWVSGRGFELYSNSSGTAAVAITGVAIVADDTVEVYYSSGTPVMVAYACAVPYDNTNQPQAGPETSRRGALIDEDPFVGLDYEVIPCTVTNGSATITSAGLFKIRGWYDRVYGAGLPADAIIKNRISDSQLLLSDVWTGPSGTAYLAFHSDQRNYCVMFAEAI
jgi:hypothetical protein